MNRQILVTGLLSLTAVSILTGCTDDKYDLSDIDTTSRFTVDNLTVPVNLSEIKLKNVVNLDDNDLIDKVVIDGKECYSIVQDGNINPTSFSIPMVHVNVPAVNSTGVSVSIPGGANVVVPELNLEGIQLSSSNKANYEFKMNDVDKALIQLKDVKTAAPISIRVVLSVDQALAAGENRISFSNLELQLPWGLIGGPAGYDAQTGIYVKNELTVGSDGKAIIDITADGLALGENGIVENGILDISGQVGIIGGALNIYVKNTAVPSSLDITADFDVSSFDIASFSGKVDYNMDDIRIDPITLNDLPDFLDSPETNLIIADPQILVDIANPVGQWLAGKGKIVLTSNFKNGSSKPYESAEFSLVGNDAKLAFCTPKEGYTTVEFDGLRHVLSNGDSGLPSSIEVAIQDIRFAGDVTDFPLGNLGDAAGDYEFNAPLAFGAGSRVVYETTEDGWNSDGLDDVNINKIHLYAVCSTDIPVDIQLSVIPVDKSGREIPVNERSALMSVPAFANNHEVTLAIESVGGPITHLDGVKFKAVISKDSGLDNSAIGPDLVIKLDQIRVTVDGYYETDF